MQLEATITCPDCGHRALETMPTDACRFFYDCKGCGTRLKPKAGDCCVFCSYGSLPCPPVQAQRGGEGDAKSCCPDENLSASDEPDPGAMTGLTRP